MAEVSTSPGKTNHGMVDYVLHNESHNKRGDNREYFPGCPNNAGVTHILFGDSNGLRTGAV
jgi:hypothetical protein